MKMFDDALGGKAMGAIDRILTYKFSILGDLCGVGVLLALARFPSCAITAIVCSKEG